jgi:hypothetical protein
MFHTEGSEATRKKKNQLQTADMRWSFGFGVGHVAESFLP